jgi:hypothetical protein
MSAEESQPCIHAYLGRKGEEQRHGKIAKSQHTPVSVLRNELGKQVQCQKRRDNGNVIDINGRREQRIV